MRAKDKWGFSFHTKMAATGADMKRRSERKSHQWSSPGRFIKEHDRWIIDKLQRDRQPLPLTPRQV